MSSDERETKSGQARIFHRGAFFLEGDMANERENLVLEICRRIKPHLADHDHIIQGDVIAETLSMWLIGYEPEDREKELNAFIAHVRALVPYHAQKWRGEGEQRH